MKKVFLILIILAFWFMGLPEGLPQNSLVKKPAYAIVIHGGAGAMSRGMMSPQREREYTDMLVKVLTTGDSLLDKGSPALDVVEACVRMMEDCPLFNAGKGAVFNSEGKNEMDASIMDGKTLMAGAVAGVTTIKNPITAARAVMEKSPHVMMAGQGAELFAKEQGLEIVDPAYFRTEQRWKEYMKVKMKTDSLDALEKKHGTVGCVVLDKFGNLAAATSTGGMTFKKYGRIGDSPIIGAGTYADNASCAVSATGWGEYFIRNVVAYDIGAIMKYKAMSLADAAEYVINQKLKLQGGTGGVICVDTNGNIAMPFNTDGMFRAWMKAGDKPGVAIYKD